jgi:hypothetical protein
LLPTDIRTDTGTATEANQADGMPNFSPAQPSLPPRLGRALLVGSIGAVLGGGAAGDRRLHRRRVPFRAHQAPVSAVDAGFVTLICGLTVGQRALGEVSADAVAAHDRPHSIGVHTAGGEHRRVAVAVGAEPALPRRSAPAR